MATKKKAATKPKTQTVKLPPVAEVSLLTKYATSKLVSAEEAMELIAEGWALTENQNDRVVVSQPIGMAKGVE